VRTVTRKPFTGWHMFGILFAFFGVVFAVNFTMAAYATGTFGGIVVENSYVASQEFNGWLEKEREQDSLGWTVTDEWRDDGRYAVQVDGAPETLKVLAIARHPLGRLPDRQLAFERTGHGTYVSTEELPQGRWTLRLELTAPEGEWRREKELQ
jgi:nitrogen fixation protein FixH